MTLHVMLSLDLSNVSDQRYHFNQRMNDSGWEKLDYVDTVWVKTYKHTQLYAYVVANELEKLLESAAKEFETDGIEYVAQIGNDAPLRCAIVKKSNGYHHIAR